MSTQPSLNGPQTTGRAYRNLSEPTLSTTRDDNVQIPLRDGSRLLADVHRPDSPGRFPVLIAASPYPRQIQDLGAPMGFVEAGISTFFVTRGYVHLIVNLRSTGGSDGTFGFFDGQERRDMYDVVEWAAGQPWSDGNVGMIGISYFAMTQLQAAVQRPPHLRAIFPVAVTPDLYEGTYHHGLLSSTFAAPFLSAIGLLAQASDALLRGRLVALARAVFHAPPLHRRFAHFNGEAAIGGLKAVTRLHHDPHPWDDLWNDIAAVHQVRDWFWDDRCVLGDLPQVQIPVYLGCDWQNVPLHLPGTFTAWKALVHNPNVRMALLGEHGLSWPWESLHTEALAWFDRWLKGADTGITDGPAIRYVLPGADIWCVSDTWPPPVHHHVELCLAADGTLAEPASATDGSRTLLCPGPGFHRSGHVTSPALPDLLSWQTGPLPSDLDVVGEIELRLCASATASDTAWIVALQDVSPDDSVTDVTSGWLRASMREVDEARSRPGCPVLPCRNPLAVPPGELVDYRIPLVPNARRFAAGHRIRLVLTSDDQPQDHPAALGFRHTPVGTTSRNTIDARSTLLLPAVSVAVAVPGST